jgi:hypothetical protein
VGEAGLEEDKAGMKIQVVDDDLRLVRLSRQEWGSVLQAIDSEIETLEELTDENDPEDAENRVYLTRLKEVQAKLKKP